MTKGLTQLVAQILVQLLTIERCTAANPRFNWGRRCLTDGTARLERKEVRLALFGEGQAAVHSVH